MTVADTSGMAQRLRDGEWFRVCARADLAEGVIRRVSSLPPIAVAVWDGTPYAFEDRCPHAGALLSRGPLIDGRVVCLAHGARFRLCDGAVLCPPARRDLRTYDLAVHDGEVYLRAPGERRRGRSRLSRLIGGHLMGGHLRRHDHARGDAAPGHSEG